MEIEELYFSRKQLFEVKKVLMIYFFIANMQLFTSQNIPLMDWSIVDYLWIIVMFLSAVWTLHSDGTHSLQRIHQWARDEMLNL